MSELITNVTNITIETPDRNFHFDEGIIDITVEHKEDQLYKSQACITTSKEDVVTVVINGAIATKNNYMNAFYSPALLDNIRKSRLIITTPQQIFQGHIFALKTYTDTCSNIVCTFKVDNIIGMPNYSKVLSTINSYSTGTDIAGGTSSASYSTTATSTCNSQITTALSNNNIIIDGKNYKLSDITTALDYTLEQTNNKKEEPTIKENNKEEYNMFDKIFNKYHFGELKSDALAYSMNGIAFKTNDNTYSIYNQDGTFTNVGNLIMDMPIYIMPVALKDIKPGDIILHYGINNLFVIVEKIEDNSITVAEPLEKQRKILIPEKSIFGFDFVAKVVTPMNMFKMQANTDNPFGNMLPFMFMGDNNKDSSFLMAMMMMQGGTENPYLPFLLMNDKDDKNNMFKYMMMTQMMGANTKFSSPMEEQINKLKTAVDKVLNKE